MRNVVIAAVGDDGREVGQLQRRTAQRILPDRERQHRERVPRTPVLAVIEGPVGDIAVAFVEEIRTQLAAEPEALDIGFPDVVALLHAPVFGIVEDVAEDIAEIGVARGGHRKAQIQRRSVGVAGHLQASGLIAHVAGVEVRRPQHPLLQTDKPLHQFEGRARRVSRPHRPVEQRLALVAEHLHIVVAAFAAHQLVGIVGRRGDHHQNLARRRLDSHRGPHLAAHQLLAQQLQACVDGAHEVAARIGQRIVAAVHVGALDGSVGVDLLDFDALAAPELRLVGRFHAAHTHIVADLVVRMAFQIVRIHLADITQQIAAHLAGILPHGAVDGVETPEITLVEAQFVLLGDVTHHEARRPRTHPRIGQLPVELHPREVQHLAQAGRIEAPFVDLARDDHQVVAFAALDQVFAVAVENLAPRRVLHHVPQHIGPGEVVVARVEQLDVGQTPHYQREDQQHDDLQRPHPHKTLRISHTRMGSLAVKMRAMIQMKPTDTAELTTTRSSVCSAWVHERASSEKKTAWWISVSTTR